MTTFSKRLGLVSAVKSIQVNEMDDDLRNGLWNTVKLHFLEMIEKYSPLTNATEYKEFCRVLWLHFYKLPIDRIPNPDYRAEEFIRERFFHGNWYEVYDFVEFVSNLDAYGFRFDAEKLRNFCNRMLERENSGYRFVKNVIAPITNEKEVDEIEEAIDVSGQFTALRGANTHLKAALDKLAEKENPDYRNSIKESVSAIEAVAKAISRNPKDSLGGALDKIKGKIKLHTALERGFKQIYGYTSDGDGIRHALTEETSCDFEDAKYMLVSSSAFINYLISKATKAGIVFE